MRKSQLTINLFRKTRIVKLTHKKTRNKSNKLICAPLERDSYFGTATANYVSDDDGASRLAISIFIHLSLGVFFHSVNSNVRTHTHRPTIAVCFSLSFFGSLSNHRTLYNKCSIIFWFIGDIFFSSHCVFVSRSSNTTTITHLFIYLIVSAEQ